MCEEGGNLSTWDLSIIYVLSEGRVSCEFIHPAQPTNAPSSRRSSRSNFYTPEFPRCWPLLEDQCLQDGETWCLRSAPFTSRAKGCIKCVPNSCLVSLSHKAGVFLEEAICYFMYAKFDFPVSDLILKLYVFSTCLQQFVPFEADKSVNFMQYSTKMTYVLLIPCIKFKCCKNL